MDTIIPAAYSAAIAVDCSREVNESKGLLGNGTAAEQTKEEDMDKNGWQKEAAAGARLRGKIGVEEVD